MRRVGVVVACMIVTCLAFPNMPQQEMYASQERTQTLSISGDIDYEDHSSISIDGNLDFVNQGWPGNGSEDNPYVIENLSIIADSICIKIFATNVHFVIRNCFLSINGDSERYGVWLSSIENGVMENCILDYCRIGLEGARRCNLSSNTISNSDTGISISESWYCAFKNNTIIDCTYGVSVDESRFCTVESNEISAISSSAVYFYDSSTCTILNNIISSNTVGVHLIESTSCDIIANQLSNHSTSIILSSFTQRCYITKNLIQNYGGYGIVTGGRLQYHNIMDNVLTGCSTAIVARGEYSIIRNNLITNITSNGIILNNGVAKENILTNIGQCGINAGGDCLISRNIIRNSPTGIDIGVISRDCIVEFNEILECSTGISSYLADDCTIIGNYIQNSVRSGIMLRLSEGFNISNNVLLNSSLKIESYRIGDWYHIVQNNTVNGRKLGYYVNLSNIELDCNDLGQVTLADCKNVSIQNHVFETTSTDVQIAFSDSCTVANCTFLSNSRPLILLYSQNCRIIANNFNNASVHIVGNLPDYWIHHFENNSINGLSLGYFANVNDAYVNGSQYGQIIFSNCSSIIMKGGEFDHVRIGAQVVFSRNITIEYGRFSNNKISGISITKSVYCNFIGNNIESNGIGIFLYDSDICILRNNTVTKNLNCGVQLNEQSSRNSIYWNIIGKNHVSNALDFGSLNEWDDGVQCGNYWGDYSGIGLYRIQNYENQIYDRYPNGTIGDLHPPVITPVPDFEITIDSQGSPIIWTVWDSYPKSYQILKNGTIVEGSSWDRDTIVFSVEGLDVGLHNITLFLYDYSGNSASDSVFVIVIAQMNSTSWMTSDLGNSVFPMMISFSILLVFVIVSLIIRKSQIETK